MSTWVVPGAPLEEGKGWRIWYSAPKADADRLQPKPVTVHRGTTPKRIRQTWQPLEPLAAWDRMAGVLTIQLEDVPDPGEMYDVVVPDAGRSEPFRWRSMPANTDAGVSFLFASCFWQPNDREGAYSAAMRELAKLKQPAFKLLMGDQVYQDYPFNWLLPKSSFELYADRYAEYWGNPGYQEVLTSCPNFFSCDDHEFWNDFPEPQRHLPRTWSAGEREEMTQAATQLFHRYQASANPGGQSSYSFDVGRGADTPPVSFFVSDTRSRRARCEEGADFLESEQWTKLTDWAHRLEGPGVLVLAQPLFQPDGDWKDHSLSNFSSAYGRLCAVLEDVLAGGDGRPAHDILILTGDIHAARFSVGSVRHAPNALQLYELVASPASRVGPFFRRPTPQAPPSKFIAKPPDGRSRVWEVVPAESDVIPTIDNNVGAVRLSPGTNRRVRFELEIWRIRPYAGTYLRRLFGGGQPGGALRRLYARELQLR